MFRFSFKKLVGCGENDRSSTCPREPAKVPKKEEVCSCERIGGKTSSGFPFAQNSHFGHHPFPVKISNTTARRFRSLSRNSSIARGFTPCTPDHPFVKGWTENFTYSPSALGASFPYPSREATATIAENSSAFKEEPPMRPPSMSGSLSSSSQFLGFMEPP